MFDVIETYLLLQNAESLEFTPKTVVPFRFVEVERCQSDKITFARGGRRVAPDFSWFCCNLLLP